MDRPRSWGEELRDETREVAIGQLLKSLQATLRRQALSYVNRKSLKGLRNGRHNQIDIFKDSLSGLQKKKMFCMAARKEARNQNGDRGNGEK